MTYVFFSIIFLFTITLLVISILEYRYIRFVLNRYFFMLENVEKVRDDLIELELSFKNFTRNPIIMMESDYKHIGRLLSESKEKMMQFEEFYQNLPEKREKNEQE